MSNLSLADQARLELYSRSPHDFRQNLLVDGPNHEAVPFGTIMDDVQQKDFAAIDPSLMWLAECPVVGRNGKITKAPRPDIRKFYLQRSRGRSKTTDRAIDLLWLTAFARKKLELMVVGDDKEQGMLIRSQMLKVLQHNTWLYDLVDVQKKAVVNHKTDTTIEFLSRDTYSGFGKTPNFILCDEFTHWTQEEMWVMVNSSFPKAPCAMVISCNAGTGMGWQWRVAETARRYNGKTWYYHAPYGPAAWQDPEELEEQKANLGPEHFERLWLNKWQVSDGQFVTITEADACVDPNLEYRTEAPSDGLAYVAAIDFAEKNDRTVAVVGHMDGDRIVVDKMDVLDPRLQPEGFIRVEWCEQWMKKVRKDFGKQNGEVYFVLDKHQLLYIIQKLKDEGFWIEEFDFQSGRGNWELCYILRHLIVQGKVKWYEGCGRIYDSLGRVWAKQGDRDDLAMELAELIVKPVGQKWRIDHKPGLHDDRAFALGAICRMIVQNGEGAEEWNITPPSASGGFAL